MGDADKIKAAVELMLRYGSIEGEHHKTWVIDQTLRILLGKTYDVIMEAARDGEDGPHTYDPWPIGIAP